MLAETQDEVYFNRMKSSIGDKAHMVPYLKPGKVLDIGSGGGEFAALLNDAGYEVTGLDGSREAVNHSTNLGVQTIEGYTHQIDELIPPLVFDSITCSSIIHEIYSYGRGIEGTACTIESVEYSLNQFRHVLKDDGVLVIRDGIMPADWDMPVEVVMKDPEGIRLAEKYLDMIPFRGTGIRKVDLQLKAGTDNILVGDMESAMEFLYTYTWGEVNYPREAQELYGLFTLTEYVQFLETHGFEVTHAEEYIQTGYPANLMEKAYIQAGNKRLPYPNSNCLIVAKKKVHND